MSETILRSQRTQSKERINVKEKIEEYSKNLLFLF